MSVTLSPAPLPLRIPVALKRARRTAASSAGAEFGRPGEMSDMSHENLSD